MRLELKQVLPKPLIEKNSANSSAIWLKNIAIQSPEYIAVQAASGTGKTSLVHSLYRLRNDYEGAILWNEKNIATFKSEELAKFRAENVSIIFQDMRLFEEMTAWENVEIKRNLTNTITADETNIWMERLGIGNKKHSVCKTLSYGEQQRLSIIRALLQPFSFLLMDEPFSHLDLRNKKIAATLILEIVQKNNAGMLLADLDQNEYFPYTKTLLL